MLDISPGFQDTLVAHTVKNLLAMQETRVQSLGWEDSSGEENGNPLHAHSNEDTAQPKFKKKIIKQKQDNSY